MTEREAFEQTVVDVARKLGVELAQTKIARWAAEERAEHWRHRAESLEKELKLLKEKS